MDNYGNIIKRLRVSSNLSQKEIAFGICSQGMISDIERGSKVPSSDILFKILRKLGVIQSEDDLFNKIEEQLHPILYNRDFEKLEKVFQTIDKSALENECEEYYYYFYKGVIEYEKKCYSDASLYFLYAADLVKGISLIDYHHCILYKEVIHFTEHRSYNLLDSIEERLNFCLFNYPCEIVLKKFHPFFFLLEFFLVVDEYEKINVWARKLLKFLSKYKTTRYVDKIYRILSLKELRENNDKEHNKKYWEYRCYYLLFFNFNQENFDKNILQDII